MTLGATTAVVAGMSPFLGAVAANAAPVQGSATLLDPYYNGQPLSGANNGTDSLVHLYADVQQSTGGAALLTTVNFEYCDQAVDVGGASCTPTHLIVSAPVQTKPAGADAEFGGDSFAVGTWTIPTLGDTYNVRAAAVDANSQTVISANATSSVTTNASAANVYITRPHDNSLVGYYDPNSIDGLKGLVNVVGTATTPGDPVVAEDDAGGISGTAHYDGTTNKWAADVKPANVDVPTAGVAGEKSIADIYAYNTSTFAEQNQAATVYLQQLAATNGFTLDPASGYAAKAAAFTDDPTACLPAPATCKLYTLKATDQNGNPISGMPFSLAFTDPNNDNSVHVDTVDPTDGKTVNQAAAWADATAGFAGGTAVDETTNAFGQFTFALQDNENEAVGITAKSEFDQDTFNAASDYTVTGTFTTAQQTAVSGTATVVGHPAASIYPTQTYGSYPGLTQDGPSPAIEVNLKDANGQPVANANAQYFFTRTIVASTNPGPSGTPCADTNTYPKTSANGNTAGTDGSGNVYIPVTAAQCPTEAGNDVYTVYLEKNGTPGYQAGADTLVGTQTLTFGPEQIYFSPCSDIPTFEGGATAICNAQQKAGTDKTVSIKVGISDGTTVQPIGSRKIDIVLVNGTGVAGTDYGFSSASNAGLAKVNATSGDITTAADGTASVTVFDNHVETLNVKASDPTLGATTAEDAKDQVAFRNYSAVLNTAGASNNYSADGQISPLNNAGAAVGAPGQPLIQCFAFKDQSNAPLANESISLATNAGFFTDLPNGGATKLANDSKYVDLHFDTAIADGQPIKGDLHSNGQSATVVTDANGVGCANLGILTSSHFAVDGTVSGTVTAQLDGAGSTLNVDNNQVLFTTDAAKGGRALNPGTMTIVQGRFDNNGKFQVQSGKPSGEKATASKNTVPIDTVNTIVEQTDSFGNPISEPVTVTSTGTGVLGTVNQTISGAYNNIQNAASNSALVIADVAQVNDPNADNPVTGDQTVNYDWTAAKDTGLVNTTTKSTAVNSTTQDLKDSYTVTWYVRDPTKFHYVTSMTPGHKEHAGTPITTSVTVTDNELRAVQGLGVEFIRSGPQGQTQDTGNPNTCNQFSTECTNALFTDVQGKTGFTFNSTKVGKFTITTIVTDASGNEVGRSVSTGTLTKAKAVKVTIHAAKHSFKKGTRHKLHGNAPAGHDVKIYRGGHKVATVLANNKGHWHKVLKFTKGHKYFARSNGHKSGTIRIKVHK